MRLKPTKQVQFWWIDFLEKSKRFVDVEQARQTMSGAPLQYVGVFQNHPAAQVADIATQLGLFAVQLHGEEESAYVRELRASVQNRLKFGKPMA